VKKLLLLFLLLLTPLIASKIIYLNYKEVPNRVIKGSIFPITIKSISIIPNDNNITYNFSNPIGLDILNTKPKREESGKYFLDTFYFLVKNNKAKLPDIYASLADIKEYNSTLLLGTPLNVISLNPKQNFSNIIANSFTLLDYKTTNFDNKHNILVFQATAKNSDINAMNFKNVYKQGIESSDNSYFDSNITYFVIMNKDMENFSFSYFNLLENKFDIINIPIIIDDDSVTTQSDLKPTDQSKEKIKLLIATVFMIILLLFALLRKKYIYIVIMIIPIAYISYLLIPSKNICIKKGANIRLLPVYNGTIFQTTTTKYSLQKEGSIKGYTKVKLYNNKVGWVKDEDICSH